MIRPLTCLAMLIAAGSGLYLYQAKHQAEVLDRQIATVTRDTGKIAAHIAVLRAEYALLNDPSRLQDLASANLPSLAPMAPGQFTTMAALDSRLPPVAAPAPPAVPAASAADSAAKPPQVPFDYPPAPLAPAPGASVPVASAAPTADRTVVAAAAPVSPPAPPRPAAHPPARRPRPASVLAAARPMPRRALATAYRADPLAIPTAALPLPSAPPAGGSVLGMARGLAEAPVSYQRYRAGASEMMTP